MTTVYLIFWCFVSAVIATLLDRLMGFRWTDNSACLIGHNVIQQMVGAVTTLILLSGWLREIREKR